MSTNQYHLVDDPFKDWQGCEALSFKPTPRQAALLKVFADAREAGLNYNSQVIHFAAERLHLTPEDLARNHNNVVGGDFGYDLYMARKCDEAQRKHAAEAQAKSMLACIPAGTALGTLVFNDYKRTTGVVVADGTCDDSVVLNGKRGRAQVQITTGFLAIKSAFERATSLGMRKDSFEEFCRGLGAQQPRQATITA